MKKIITLVILGLLLFTACESSYLETVRNTTNDSGITIEQIILSKLEALESYNETEKFANEAADSWGYYTFDTLLTILRKNNYDYPKSKKIEWAIEGKTKNGKIVKVQSDNFKILFKTTEDGDFINSYINDMSVYNLSSNTKISSDDMKTIENLYNYIKNERNYSMKNGITYMNFYGNRSAIGFTELHEAQYKNKKNDGIYNIFYDNGSPQKTSNYKDGLLDGIYKTFYKSGQIELLTTFKEGKIDGTLFVYGETGKILSEYTFKNNKLDGISKIYNEKGEIGSEFHFKDGLLDGVSKGYLDGKLKGEVLFTNNKFNGFYKEYYQDGGIAYEFNFKNDMPYGEGKEYDIDGKILSTFDNIPRSSLENRIHNDIVDEINKFEEILHRSYWHEDVKKEHNGLKKWWNTSNLR